jgi:hypothetical protein
MGLNILGSEGGPDIKRRGWSIGLIPFMIMIISSICTITSKLLGYDMLTVVFSGVAAFAGIVAVCLMVWRIRKDKKELEKYDKQMDEYDELLSNPFEIHFLIPSREKYDGISYYEQDDQEHLVDELQISSRMEDIIFLWIKPRISIEVGERYFGFESKEGGEKPEIRYSNPFVREESKIPDYYIDWHGYYHMIGASPEQRVWQVGEVYNPSFKIMTRAEGDFLFQAVFHINGLGHNQIKEKKYQIIRKRLGLVCLDGTKKNTR